jgi:hypothetical protein
MADLDFTYMATARVRERVVHDLLIMIDGKEWDVENLRELLGEVESGDIVVTGEGGPLLMRIGVLESIGSHKWMMGARTGPNFDAFKQSLDDLLKKHHPGYN